MIAEVIATAPEPMIPGNWIILFLGALGSFVTLLIGKAQGRKEAESRRVTIEDQPVGVRLRSEFVTKPELEEHIDRTEQQFKEIKDRIAEDRLAAREALGKVHHRIDDLVTSHAETKGTVTQIDKKVDKLLDIELRDKGGKE